MFAHKFMVPNRASSLSQSRRGRRCYSKDGGASTAVMRGGIATPEMKISLMDLAFNG